jgi:hypothetical protein
MADDLNKEIIVKLKVEDREITTKIPLADDQVKKLNQSLAAGAESGKIFGQNLGDEFDGINVTTKDLLERLEDLKLKFSEAVIGSEAYNRWKREIQDVEKHLARVKGELRQTEPVINTNRVATSGFRTSLIQASYALGELDPALGNIVRGLNPVLTGFSAASVGGGGFRAVLGAISAQIMGPVGLAVALSFLTTVLVQLIRSKDKAKDATKAWSLETVVAKTAAESWAESLKKVRDELLALTDEQLIKKMEQLNNELDRLFDELTEAATFEAAKYGGLLAALGITPDTQEVIDKIVKAFTVLKEAETVAEGKGGMIPRLKADIKKLEDLKEEAKTEKEIKEINIKIADKKKEIDRLNELGVKKAKEQLLPTQELLKELEKVEKMLKDPNITPLDEKILGKKRVQLLNDLRLVDEYLESIIGNLKIEDIDIADFTDEAVGVGREPRDLPQQTEWVKTLAGLYAELGDTMQNSLHIQNLLFKNAHSWFQILLNDLAAIIARTFLWKLILAGIGILTGGSAAKAVIPIPSTPGAAQGAIVNRPTIMQVGEGNEPEGVFPLSWLNDFLPQNTVRQINVHVDGEIRKVGKDFVIEFKEMENYVDENLRGRSFARND